MPPASLNDDARRDQARRQIDSENLTSHYLAVESALHWCLEAMRRDADVEYWKERAEAAERLLEQQTKQEKKS